MRRLLFRRDPGRLLNYVPDPVVWIIAILIAGAVLKITGLI